MIQKRGSFNIEATAEQLKKAKKNLPLRISNDAKNHFLEGFRKEGGQTDDSIGGWKKRKWPDLTKTGKPSGTKGRRGILAKTGRLRRSIKITRKTFNLIKIASVGVPYAEIHNKGGTIVQKTTAKQRAFLKYASGNLGRSRTFKGSAFEQMLLASSMSKTLTINIPKREFIGNSKILERKILLRIKRELDQSFKK